MKILVVPTIRKDCIEKFIDEWSSCERWDETLIIEDQPQKTFQCDFHHYCWEDIEKDLGENAWIISRRDSAIRSYGFYKAYQMGAEYIFTLDDDCYPSSPNFIGTHISQMEHHTKWDHLIPNMRTRGLPYKNLGKLENVVANIGLWENVPDIDAVTQLTRPRPYFIPPNHDRIIPTGQYVSMTGMNLAFKREVAVLSYFPLMGVDSPYGRFDDIWCGVIFKKVCDHLKYYISCGQPFVEHVKASNVFKNLIKEAPGIEMNETFWEIVDKIALNGDTPKECMAEVGVSLSKREGYIGKLGQAIGVWCSLFER